MITGYNFPEGVQYKLRYSIGWDFYDSSMKLLPNMVYAFAYQPIVTIKIWDTSNVTDMSNMFNGCSSLTTIPQLDTSNVTDMSNMFYGCSELTTIPQLDTSKVVDMRYMFAFCNVLTTIPLLDTSNVTNMRSMFSNDSRLVTIPQLDTSKVTDITEIFSYCNALTSIPLLDCSSIGVGSYGAFGYGNLNYLTDMGGFKNLKASWTSNFLDKAPNATVESLMNVINNLWDWADYPDGKVTNPNGTVVSYGTTHTLKFGTTNLNKLTAEQKAVATNKGWTLT